MKKKKHTKGKGALERRTTTRKGRMINISRHIDVKR